MEESGAGTRGAAPADRISSLSDDILLEVLSHIGYAGAAARTTLLSSRWRGHSSRKRGTVPRPTNRVRRPEFGVGDGERNGPIRWPGRVPVRPLSPQIEAALASNSDRRTKVGDVGDASTGSGDMSLGGLMLWACGGRGRAASSMASCEHGSVKRRHAAAELVGMTRLEWAKSRERTGGFTIWRDLGRLLFLWATAICDPSGSNRPTVPESSSPQRTDRVPCIEPVVREMYTRDVSYFFQAPILVPRFRFPFPPTRKHGNYGRGIFPQLPSADVTLHDVPLRSLEDELRRAACPGVRLLDIAVPVPVQDWTTTASSARKCSPRGYWQFRLAIARDMQQGPYGTVSSVLREAAWLSPVQLRFMVPPNIADPKNIGVNLPCFHRATSIELQTPPDLTLTHSRASSGFPLLESLSISGCRIDLNALIPRCPRLRTLRLAAGAPGADDFTIRSSMLQGLLVDRRSMPTCRIVIMAPALKRLTIALNASRELSVSVAAPVVEQVSWRCSYASMFHGLGLWRLLEVRLETDKGHGRWASCSNASTREEDGCSQPPRVNVLSLTMCSAKHLLCSPDGDIEFAAEISKHMVTDFSGLELHLRTAGHDFGSCVWRLFGMHHIRKTARSLRIVLLKPEVKVEHRVNCPCDGPWNQRTEPWPVSLPNLEKLQIEGFEGEDQEFNFLKLMLRRASMLTRVIVRLPDQVTPNDVCCTKLHNIFAAYPSVEGTIDLIPSN